MKIKIELENLAFAILEPSAYRSVTDKLNATQAEREHYIQNIANQLKLAIQEDTEIDDFDISSRAKHAYSVHSKMLRKGVSFEEIYDELAIRILVSNKQQCYEILELVNELWKHVPDEFDDYILHPKSNGYRSIHTALIGPEGRHFEVQIRTYAMHEESEFGFSAHCLYKENRQVCSMHKARVLWLRQIIEWSGQIHVTAQTPIYEKTRQTEKIYVFTSQTHICELPLGATVLDYAYHIDDDFAKHSVQARVNGRPAKLSDVLNNGDEVEVATSFVSYPKEEWLLGDFVTTELAKGKIKEWLERRRKNNTA